MVSKFLTKKSVTIPPISVGTNFPLSEYNKKGLWAGWDNPPLSPEGFEEARKTGGQLKDFTFNYAYTSALLRAQQTMDEILKILNQNPPITKNQSLNERNYGDFTAKNKWEVKEKIGEEEFLKLRGQNADPAAFNATRFWVSTGVKVELKDKNDPTPYWLIATRKPKKLAAALD